MTMYNTVLQVVSIKSNIEPFNSSAIIYLNRSRIHLGGREKPGSWYSFCCRDSLGSLKIKHGNGLLCSSTETSKGTNILGLLRTEADHYCRV